MTVVCLLSLVASAAPPEFPRFGGEKSVRGELVEADFIHRTGKFRTRDGELRRFSMPPHAILTYQGAEADLRDVPLGTEFDFLLLPDEEGQLTRLVGTKHAGKTDATQKAERRQRFVDFTQDRGLAGWIEQTSGKTLTVTFFSGDPNHFGEMFGEAFAPESPVTVCVANEELRTWQPTSCGEKGTIVETKQVPIAGHGSGGRQVIVKVNNMLEGFRQGRIVRIFGNGWKVRNQFFQECLINYGYQQQSPPDFRECHALHYPEQFPYRTDFSNRGLPWFQAKEGSQPPMHAEHVMYGELTALDAADQSGEFRVEGSDELVKFNMLAVGGKFPPVRFQMSNREGAPSRLSSLELGLRYRFHMFQDSRGNFSRCSFITDDMSHAALNALKFKILRIDPKQQLLEVAWQPQPVKNYNGDMETPPPYGHSVLRVARTARLWRDKAESEFSSLQVGELLRYNSTAEFPGQPAQVAELWVMVEGKR